MAVARRAHPHNPQLGPTLVATETTGNHRRILNKSFGELLPALVVIVAAATALAILLSSMP